jgi:hypothetical protein
LDGTIGVPVYGFYENFRRLGEKKGATGLLPIAPSCWLAGLLACWPDGLLA